MRVSFLFTSQVFLFFACNSPAGQTSPPKAQVVADSGASITSMGKDSIAGKTGSPISGRDSLEPYYFDTVLKGGYFISFKADESQEYLYLRKGRRVKEISSGGRGLPYKSLGYVAVDFRQSFVLAHSFGSGNPHQIELIEKKTGLNLLDSEAIWLDASERKELLLYVENDTATRLILYELGNMQKHFFPFPPDIEGDIAYKMGFRILSVTPSAFTIRYTVDGNYKRRKYKK